MSGFQFSSFGEPPSFSSPAPSTPDKQARNGGSQRFAFGATNPSTTPAGPPPSSAGSFTPAGPPPDSVFGSSILNGASQNPVRTLNFTASNQPSFKFTGQDLHVPKSSPAAAPFMKSKEPPARSGLSKGFRAPTPDDEPEDESYLEDAEGEPYDDEEARQEFSRQFANSDYGLDEIDRMVDEMAEDEDDGEYEDDDEDMIDFQHSAPGRKSYGSTNFRQNRGDSGMDVRNTIEGPAEPKEYLHRQAAKAMYNQMGTTPVDEQDDLILRNEALVIRLYDEGITANEDVAALDRALETIPSELLELWNEYDAKTAVHVSEEYVVAIGPGPRATKFARANFVASLLLRLHHAKPIYDAPIQQQQLRGSIMRNAVVPVFEEKKIKPLPLVLLEWMDDYHNPYPSQFEKVMSHRPSPSNHRLFWDTMLHSLLRGRVVAVMNALKSAGWKYAWTPMEEAQDNPGPAGYSGVVLANIERVMNEAVQTLQMCPAANGDWDTGSGDWTLFRLRVDQAVENLRSFAEGRDREQSRTSGTESYKSKLTKAQSQVPWHIYQNLLALYDLVLGDASSIIESSEDWCEATIGLTVWWAKGNDDHRMTLSRSGLNIRDELQNSYFDRLTDAFHAATAESTDFQVNALNPVELALACVFESDIESAIGLLRAWSGPISSAVAEIASLGGWLPRPASENLIAMDSLDQEDLDVLGINRGSEMLANTKDLTLVVYAKGLGERGKLESTPSYGRPTYIREGWEIAIEVLGRLDSTERSDVEVTQMLDSFTLESSDTVDKLWRLLNDLGMTNHAESVAAKYAEYLGEHTFKYGEALWYYALSHKSIEVKKVLDHLISYSLWHSTAYPPESDMDSHLEKLISSPKAALAEMGKLDFEAAKLLQKMLSGYATLRKFYDLRDEELRLADGKKPTMRARARKQEAFKALITVITSSDDNIRGGLYDKGRGAVVGVEVLLVLLGEAMVFVNQPELSVTTSQIDALLKAIEDLQTIPASTREKCEEFFQMVITTTPGMKGSNPMDLLKKSTSSLSGTSSFSLVDSWMAASQLKKSIPLKTENIQRAWDWRRGLSAGITANEVLQIMRYGLARDQARAWVLEADSLKI